MDLPRFSSRLHHVLAVVFAAVVLLAPVRAQTSPPGNGARVSALLGQAKALRASGDTSTALSRLRQALALAPNDPTIICEMALTYELMGLGSKAATQWERLAAMGNTTPFFGMAQEHLRPIPDQAQLEGFAPGAMMRLMELTLQREADARMVLKIPIKARQPVAAGDVAIQVIFFDLLADAEVVQTNATVTHRFTTSPINWAEGGIEILEAEYNQPKAENSDRKYFGYAVSLYYKNLLQDKRAEPKKLLEMYPPRIQLDSEP